MAEFKHPGPPKNWPQIMVLRRMWRVAARLRELHQAHFQRLGIPIAEFDMLSALGNTDGLRMKDLAEIMITTAPNVTRICTAMEAKGLVQRQRSPHSDREVVARLTPEGQKLFEKAFAQTVNYSAAIVDTSLSRAELKALAVTLEKMLAKLRSPD